MRVRPGIPAAQLLSACGLTQGWCGPVKLDPEHPVGQAPLIHGARISATPQPSTLPLTGPRLQVREGPDAGALIPLATQLVVGRYDSCDVVIDDPTVSGEHATVSVKDVRRGRHVRVRDMRSANGTVTLGGRRLRAGDVFTVGRTTIELAGVEQDEGGAHKAPPFRWTALVAGAGSGLMFAAMTGRWTLALVGVVPAALPWLAQLRRKRAPAPEPWQPPPGPLAVRGKPAQVAGYVRAVLLARGRRPLDERWREPWTRWLDEPASGDEIIGLAPGEPWPSWSAGRVDVASDHRVEDDQVQPRTLGPLSVSAGTADIAARRQAAAAPTDGLPSAVRWADLPGTAVAKPGDLPAPLPPGRSRSLQVRIGSAAEGPYVLDLDADGPHFLVAGTTGAGKSVALETIVAALAYQHGPADLNLALIDFKGGAGLRACMGLPHVSATLTDLDGALASRAIAGLAHELETRKAALETHGLSSLAEWEARGGAPARLLVVIDEYQEIAARYATFLPDIARIAAQGRSLGLHLVLATQRPAGAVTPEVRANVSTTIALRVASDSESHDLVGSAAAAQISPATPGRAIVARGGQLTEVQIAAPGAEASPPIVRVGEPVAAGRPLANVAAARWQGHATAPALWRAPLPSRWDVDTVNVDQPGIAMGYADRPTERTQGVVSWEPSSGPAIVVGPPRAGRTSALRAIAAQAEGMGLTPVWLPKDPRLASRTLHLAANRDDVLVLVDDMEAALTWLAEADDGAAVDDLLRRPALRLPTAMAGGPGMPSRLASSAGVLAVLSGLEPTVAQQWGVPRSVTTNGPAVPGRGVIRAAGHWDAVQLAVTGREVGTQLVADLGTGNNVGEPGGPTRAKGNGRADMWGVGGDDAGAVPAPTERVAIVGPPGPERDAIADSMPNAHVECVDLPALIPQGVDTVIVSEPTARAVRAVAPHHWRGLATPTPLAGHVVLVTGGTALAVRLVRLPSVTG